MLRGFLFYINLNVKKRYCKLAVLNLPELITFADFYDQNCTFIRMFINVERLCS
jgi:hypothetical protein